MTSLRTKKYLMRLEKRGAEIPIDHESPLYRICPQCIDEFMAETEQDVYCCTKCKDDFNNAKKARKKLSQQKEERPVETAPDTPFIEDLKTNLQMNVDILEQIFNGNPEGNYATLEELDKLGFDLNSNNGQCILYNTPDPDECAFVVYGPFRLYWITFDTVLIVKP